MESKVEKIYNKADEIMNVIQRDGCVNISQDMLSLGIVIAKIAQAYIDNGNDDKKVFFTIFNIIKSCCKAETYNEFDTEWTEALTKKQE